MKSLSQAYEAHIKSGATSLCFCWRIARKDGMVFGFTDHDQRVHFEGQNFEPAAGLDGAEQVSTLGPQTDTGEVLGVLTSDTITEDDIAQGKFDSAQVQTYRVNWRDPQIRHLQRTDQIGEIKRSDGIFQAELRSLEEQLNVHKGRRYSPLCDAQVGDVEFGIDLHQEGYRLEVSIAEKVGRHSIVLDGGLSVEPDWFSHGEAEWLSGPRAGLVDRITKHEKRDGLHLLHFAQPVGDWVQVQDQVRLTVGYDRTFESCKTKFDNAPNFRGFPHIPGNDAVLRYPKEGDSFAGRPLVK